MMQPTTQKLDYTDVPAGTPSTLAYMVADSASNTITTYRLPRLLLPVLYLLGLLTGLVL